MHLARGVRTPLKSVSPSIPAMVRVRWKLDYVPRDEGRVTTMCASLPIYPSKLLKVASLETEFRSLSSLGRIVCCLKCLSDSECKQMCSMTVAILDKSPLQGVSFEVGGRRGTWLGATRNAVLRKPQVPSKRVGKKRGATSRRKDGKPRESGLSPMSFSL